MHKKGVYVHVCVPMCAYIHVHVFKVKEKTL